MKDLIKKSICEFIGTFVLVFVACGVAALTGGELVATSLAFGLTIVAMAYSIGRISGCHINPAVSLACLLTKRMTGKEFVMYVVSQILGGYLGAVLLFGINAMGGNFFAGNACNLAVNYSVIFNDLTTGKVIAALLVEIVLTCIFVYTILNATDDKAGNAKLAGIIIGLTLVLVHLVGIKLTGTSVNPARSIATAFGALIYLGDTAPVAQLWIFIVGPLVGGALAAVLFKFLHKEEKAQEIQEEK